MTEPLFVGIDLGTTRAKAGVYDRQGTEHALAIVRHSSALQRQGEVTQDAEAWWGAVCGALREVLARVEPARIAAVAVCGQGPSLVATDERMRPRGPALTWMDQRARDEARELSARLGRPVDPSRHAAKALRLARSQPDADRRWFLQSWDYIAARLSGVVSTSSAWEEGEIAAAGLPRAQFPPYVAPGAPLGSVSAEAARDSGLPEGTTVVGGTNDSIAACIGSGAVRRGRSVILGGTSGGFVLCWDPTPGAWVPPPDTYPEPPGLRYLGATISSSGLLIDWVASLCGARPYDGWLDAAAEVPVGAGGLVILPYISGVYLPYAADNRASIDNPAARGVIFGLSLEHNNAHLIRAAMEGIAFAVRQIYESTLAQGGATEETVTVGGQAYSAIWNRIKTDVLGLPVLVPRVVEAGALGAACLAAGSSIYSGVWEAANAMILPAVRLEPDPTAHARYNRIYGDIYSELYPRLSDLFTRRSMDDQRDRPER